MNCFLFALLFGGMCLGVLLLYLFDPEWTKGMDDFHPASRDPYDGSIIDHFTGRP